MNLFLKMSTATAFIVALSPSPALALPPSEIATQCSIAPKGCVTLVHNEIKALKTQELASAELDFAIVALVGALAAEPDVPAHISAAVIRDLSVEVSNSAMQQQITSIADVIDAGETFETAALGELASSN